MQIVDYSIHYQMDLSDISDDYLEKLAQEIVANPEKFKAFEIRS